MWPPAHFARGCDGPAPVPQSARSATSRNVNVRPIEEGRGSPPQDATTRTLGPPLVMAAYGADGFQFAREAAARREGPGGGSAYRAGRSAVRSAGSPAVARDAKGGAHTMAGVGCSLSSPPAADPPAAGMTGNIDRSWQDRASAARMSARLGPSQSASRRSARRDRSRRRRRTG